jgi:pimeloyl-ACP methyl ester carboxylesterase
MASMNLISRRALLRGASAAGATATTAIILAPSGRADSREATPESLPVVVGPEFAECIDIGGRDLFLHYIGEGSPTVILEDGFGDTSGIWDKVQPEIARTTRVCSYDRAGLGQSDPPPTDVRTFGEVVTDLHALLAAAGVPAPYVLVGNSIGGLFVRLYAGTYSEEIAGLVLVDGVPPGSFELGLIPRASPQDLERYDLMAGEAQAAAVPVPLVPVAVLVRTRDAFSATLQELEQKQADLLHGRLVVAEHSGHKIHQDQPELVIEWIRHVIAAVHDPSTWATPVMATPAA